MFDFLQKKMYCQDMKITDKKVSELIEYANNPRINDHAVDKTAAIIREFGFLVPCLIKSDNTVIDGHLRLKSARKLNLDSVPCIIVDHLSGAQIKALRISINRVAGFAEFDDELLKIELEDLKDLDFDLDLTGFDGFEIDGLLDDGEDGNSQEIYDGMPEFNQENVDKFTSFKVNISSESDLKEFAELIGQSITEKTRSINFPFIAREDLASYQQSDEQ